MTYTFTIPGPPCAKQRPRFSNGHAYTPEKTIAYESLVKMAYQGPRLEGQIRMEVHAYFQIPKSATKAQRNQMSIRGICPTKRPDADNILKICADSLNGIAYADDSQIVEATVRKFYGDPRVEVTLTGRTEITVEGESNAEES